MATLSDDSRTMACHEVRETERRRCRAALFDEVDLGKHSTNSSFSRNLANVILVIYSNLSKNAKNGDGI
jgi:hypothetical protein